MSSSSSRPCAMSNPGGDDGIGLDAAPARDAPSSAVPRVRFRLDLGAAPRFAEAMLGRRGELHRPLAKDALPRLLRKPLLPHRLGRLRFVLCSEVCRCWTRVSGLVMEQGRNAFLSIQEISGGKKRRGEVPFVASDRGLLTRPSLMSTKPIMDHAFICRVHVPHLFNKQLYISKTNFDSRVSLADVNSPKAGLSHQTSRSLDTRRRKEEWILRQPAMSRRRPLIASCSNRHRQQRVARARRKSLKTRRLLPSKLPKGSATATSDKWHVERHTC